MTALERAARRWWWALPLLLVLNTWWGTTEYGLLADAKFLIEDNTFLSGWDRFWEQATHDYFWSSCGNSIPYWRPFTKLSWFLEAQVPGRPAPVFHLVQLGWLLVAVAGVMWFGRRLGLSRAWAAAIGVLVGTHPMAAEPVSLIMARSDVTMAAAVVWSVGAWVVWARGGRRVWLVVHLVALLVGLGSKETAVASLGALLGFWVVQPDPRRNLWRVLPAVLLVVSWMGLRSVVLGHSSGGLAFEPLRLLTAGGQYVLALLPLPGVFELRSWSELEALHNAPVTALAVGAALATLGGCVFVRLRHPEGGQGRAVASDLVALLVWAAAMLAPVLLAADIYVPDAEGRFPVAARWVWPAVAPVFLLAGRWASTRESVLVRRVAMGLAVLFVASSHLAAPRAHADYASDDAMLDLEDRLLADTPEAFRTDSDVCRAAERAQVRALAAENWSGVLEITAVRDGRCADSRTARFNRLVALFNLDRFDDAATLGLGLVGVHGGDTRLAAPANLLTGCALLDAGRDNARAEALVRQAIELGSGDCRAWICLARATANRGAPIDAADHLRYAIRCVSDRGAPGSLWLKACQLYREGGAPERCDALATELEAMDGAGVRRDLVEQLRRRSP